VCAALEKAILEKGYYDDLALAFGKKGIQAMIIEGAIPEIEREANDIPRPNDRRPAERQVRDAALLAGRDNTIETLDIKIADELGVRVSSSTREASHSGSTSRYGSRLASCSRSARAPGSRRS